MKKQITETYEYSNETFSGCDIVATLNVNILKRDENDKPILVPYTRVLGEITTLSYSIYMEKKPVRSIGNVNAKDYVMGPRTIAGTLVFNVFNKHFAQEILKEINNNYGAGTNLLVDELPPFDITISAANEYGYRSRLAIYGIRLLNEGQVMSINDVYTENTYQYYATDVEYFTDEKKYYRDESSKLFKLYDNIDVNTDANDFVKTTKGFIASYLDEGYNEVINRDIRLSVNVIQPIKAGYDGTADFSLSPPQGNGVLTISKNGHEVKTINLNSDRRKGILSATLQPGLYSAVFKNKINQKNSNKVDFLVNEIIIKDILEKYAPTIEYVTNTSIEVYCNEPSHNKIKIISGIDLTQNSTNATDLKVENRRCLIENLSPKTTYTLASFNDGEKILSKTISVKTLDKYDTAYNKLEDYISYNAKLLTFKDIMIYLDLIKECKSKYTDKVPDALLKLKKEILSSKINDEFKLKLNALNELIYFANKLFNNYITTVNKEESVPIPKIMQDKDLNNIFMFDKNVTSAEFYTNYKTFVQFFSEVPRYNFQVLNGVPCSYKFYGTGGRQYYVEALIKNRRSPRLSFYVMTEDEKGKFIQNKLDKDTMIKARLYQTNDILKSQGVSSSNAELYKRNFMINYGKIDEPVFLPPAISNISEDITIDNNINNIISQEKTFYIAIANYNDLVNNTAIYKTKFSSTTSSVIIENNFNNLKDNECYAVWIEDDKNDKISNVNTFIYSKDFDIESDDLIDLTRQDIISTLRNLSKSVKSQSFKNNIDELIASNYKNNDIIDKILSSIYNIIDIDETIFVLSSLKKFIGILNPANLDFINNISYNNDTIKFSSNKSNGTILIKEFHNEKCITTILKLESEDTLNLHEYGEKLLIVCLDEKLNYKSKLIYIDKKLNKMEVI